MITLRPGGERGRTELDWLDSRHTFSFDRYYDPRNMNFRQLRVLNEDVVQPGHGFPTHPHRDMEILTWVLEGALEHRDSMGNGSVIRPGELQRMSAGTGVTHSEANPSNSEPVHLLQIWILPERQGLKPSYEQRAFPVEAKSSALRLIAARDGREGALTIHQDVELYAGHLPGGGLLTHSLSFVRHAWVQVARGAVDLNGVSLQAGDGAAISEEQALTFTTAKNREGAEILLFDLA